MVSFMNIQTARTPENALIDFSPIGNALDSNRRNALLQRESARQDEELAMRKASAGRAEVRAAEKDSRGQVEWFGKQAASVDAIQDPAQRKLIWERILSRHPDGANLDPAYRDPVNGPRMVAVEAGQWKPQAEAAGKTYEIGGKLVQVGPGGQTKEIYATPEKPDPVRDLLVQRLQGGAKPAQSPMLQPQSFEGAPPSSGLQRVSDAPPEGQASAGNAPQTIETPFGPMTREEARQLGGTMLLDPRYATAGKALLDSVNTPAGVGMGQMASNQLDERTINSATQLGRIADIRKRFEADFLKVPNRIQLLANAWTSKAGGKLAPEQEQELYRYSQFRSASVNNLNTVLKEMSGAAVTPQEYERIQNDAPVAGTGILDGDDPVSFKAKLDSTEQSLKMAIARFNFMRSRGLNFSKENLDQFMALEDVPAAMDRRGAEIEAEMKRANPKANPMSIEREAMRQVQREFGI